MTGGQELETGRVSDSFKRFGYKREEKEQSKPEKPVGLGVVVLFLSLVNERGLNVYKSRERLR